MKISLCRKKIIFLPSCLQKLYCISFLAVWFYRYNRRNSRATITVQNSSTVAQDNNVIYLTLQVWWNAPRKIAIFKIRMCKNISLQTVHCFCNSIRYRKLFKCVECFKGGNMTALGQHRLQPVLRLRADCIRGCAVPEVLALLKLALISASFLDWVGTIIKA